MVRRVPKPRRRTPTSAWSTAKSASAPAATRCIDATIMAPGMAESTTQSGASFSLPRTSAATVSSTNGTQRKYWRKPIRGPSRHRACWPSRPRERAPVGAAAVDRCRQGVEADEHENDVQAQGQAQRRQNRAVAGHAGEQQVDRVVGLEAARERVEIVERKGVRVASAENPIYVSAGAGPARGSGGAPRQGRGWRRGGRRPRGPASMGGLGRGGFGRHRWAQGSEVRVTWAGSGPRPRSSTTRGSAAVRARGPSWAGRRSTRSTLR